MVASIIDGRAIAARVLHGVAEEVDQLLALGARPGLAVILVGSNTASEIYVGAKVRRTREAGMTSFEHRLADEVSENDVIRLIEKLNADESVHGILVQLPLPAHIDTTRIMDAIAPAKDVDGFHPVNVGRLSIGGNGLVPCTPMGCMMLLDTVVSDFRGKHAVVIGKSNIVGKPIALLLLERECTVTVAHIATRDLPSIARTADIIIAAAGHPHLVRREWVKLGAIVIDVGITRMVQGDGTVRLVGDVCFDEAAAHAGAITPVPGGVGPMTIACLLLNTIRAARDQMCRPNGRETEQIADAAR